MHTFSPDQMNLQKIVDEVNQAHWENDYSGHHPYGQVITGLLLHRIAEAGLNGKIVVFLLGGPQNRRKIRLKFPNE